MILFCFIGIRNSEIWMFKRARLIALLTMLTCKVAWRPTKLIRHPVLNSLDKIDLLAELKAVVGIMILTGEC